MNGVNSSNGVVSLFSLSYTSIANAVSFNLPVFRNEYIIIHLIESLNLTMLLGFCTCCYLNINVSLFFFNTSCWKKF